MASSDRDSDEEPSRDALRMSKITDALRAAVRSLYEQDPDQVTPRQVRARVEEELDLEPQFLKSDSYWANKSKEIIQAEFEALAEHPEAPTNKETEPTEKKTPTKRTKRSAEKKNNKIAIENSRDGDQKVPAPKKKRVFKGNKQKDAVVSDGDEAPLEGDKSTTQDNELSGIQDGPHIATTAKRAAKSGAKRKKIQSEDRIEEDPSPAKDNSELLAVNGSDKSEAESEMSVVLDPSPPRKKSRSKSSPSETKKGRIKKEKPAAKLKKGKAVEQPDISPDEQQIKTLQGWLLKCGIRKVWSRELAKFETPKEKIAHLKHLLSDIGMESRYTVEKAKRIKEERELQAEVEAAQEFGGRWGNDADGPVKTRSMRSAATSQPEERRRIYRRDELAFLQDQSDESD